MKILLQSLFIISLTLPGHSQSYDSIMVHYNGGTADLHKAVSLYLNQQNRDGLLGTHHEDTRHFFLHFTVLENGGIGKDMSIFSNEDTTNTTAIAGAFQTTNGNWINNTGRDQSVCLSLDLKFTDAKIDPTQLLLLIYSEFKNGRRSGLIALRPMTVQLYPPIQD